MISQRNHTMHSKQAISITNGNSICEPALRKIEWNGDWSEWKKREKQSHKSVKKKEINMELWN